MAGIVVGSVAGAGLTLLIQRLSKLRKSGGKGDDIQERSTTSSAGGGGELVAIELLIYP